MSGGSIIGGVGGEVSSAWGQQPAATASTSQAQKAADRGNQLFLLEHNLDAALQCYAEAAQLDPTDHKILGNMSFFLLKAARVDEALERADAALRLEPDWAKGHLWRASALEACGRLAEAQRSLQRALELPSASAQDAHWRQAAQVDLVRLKTTRLVSLGFTEVQAAVALHAAPENNFEAAAQKLVTNRLASMGMSACAALSDQLDSDDDEEFRSGCSFPTLVGGRVYSSASAGAPGVRQSSGSWSSSCASSVVSSLGPQPAVMPIIMPPLPPPPPPSTMHQQQHQPNTAGLPMQYSAAVLFAQATQQQPQQQQMQQQTQMPLMMRQQPPPPQQAPPHPKYEVLMDYKNPLQCDTLWVGNLVPQATETLMRDVFSRFGKLRQVNMMLEKHCCFVSYVDWRHAGKAMEDMQNYDCFGQKLLIKYPDRILHSPQAATMVGQAPHQQIILKAVRK